MPLHKLKGIKTMKEFEVQEDYRLIEQDSYDFYLEYESEETWESNNLTVYQDNIWRELQ